MKWDWFIILSVVLIYAFFGFYTISDYGLTWDERENFVTGERALRFFQTGDKGYIEVIGDRRRLFFAQRDDVLDFGPKPHINFDSYRIPGNIFWFPPVSGILSALTSQIFYQKLGILGPVDARHSIIIILAGLLLVIIYLFALKAYGRITAVFSLISLALFPRFLGHIHNNLKDITETFFFAFTIWAFWRGVNKENWKWILLSGILFGLALGTKANALFIPLIVGIWYIAINLRNLKKDRLISLRFSLSLILFPLAAFLIFFAIWPSLWHNFWGGIINILQYYKDCAMTGESKGWNLYALKYVLYTTPLVILIFAILGILFSLSHLGKEKNKTSLLLFLWLIIPIIRVSYPGIRVEDGIRLFIEFVPALCIFAGIGAGSIHKYLPRFINKKISLTILLISFLPLLISIIRIHPYETTFFNSLIGGLRGAQKKNFPQATDYWGNSYRNGIRWLNKNGEKDSILIVSIAEHIVGLVQGIWLREDIRFRSDLDERNIDKIPKSTEKRKVYIMYITRKDRYSSVTDYCEENLKLVYSIKVQGTPILKIFIMD